MEIEELYSLGEIELSRMLLKHEVFKDPELVRRILALGAMVEVPSRLGLRPLNYAALYGVLETCKVLVESGALVNTQDTNGHTPLHYAAARGHLDVCKLLVESGADVNIQDIFGVNAIEIAYRYDQQYVFEYLSRYRT